MLTDTKLRNLKPRDKLYKVNDRDGLYVAVTESIGMPLNSPVNGDGRFVQLAVPMTLCTLTAIDRKDWREAQRSTA